MKTHNELEYCNVAVWFDRPTLHGLMQALVEAGLDVAWKESRKALQLQVQTIDGSRMLTFRRMNGAFKFDECDYFVRDIRLAVVLYRFIELAKGHAIVKIISEGQIVVKNIRYGEAVRIVEIKGAEKKVIYEKACSVTMDQVIAALKRRDAEERIPVLRLELDYELATLYDAIQAQDKAQMKRSKERLKQLRREMLLLEV
jgi:protoporphyrinogen oxidase